MDTTPAWAGRWVCRPCGERGDQIELLVFVKGITKGEAIRQLCPQEVKEDEFLPSMVLKEFLNSRLWSSEVAQELGLTVVSDKYRRPRIRFPFRRGGEVVYWQDRACLPNSTPKWLSATGPSPCPYEVDRIQNVKDDWLILVEGLPDVGAILHPYPDAAVIGIAGASSLKREWASLFKGLRLCVIADNDDAGLVMRRRVEESLGPCTHAYVPAPHGDVDAWRQADPTAFPDQLLALMSAATVAGE